MAAYLGDASRRGIEVGSGTVRLLCEVLGWPKYQPPPVRRLQQSVRCTVAVPLSKSMSFHCRAKYSSGRIPVAKPNAKTKPCGSSLAASKKAVASLGDSAFISRRVRLGNSTLCGDVETPKSSFVRCAAKLKAFATNLFPDGEIYFAVFQVIVRRSETGHSSEFLSGLLVERYPPVQTCVIKFEVTQTSRLSLRKCCAAKVDK